MNVTPFLLFLVGLLIGTPGGALASATHLARVELELGWVDGSGRFDSRVSKTVDYRLDWNSRKCEIEYKGIYYYCNLDVGQDLMDREGNILMKQLPIAHFGVKSIDALLIALGREDEDLSHMMGKVVRETSELRTGGMLLPFYTCEACAKNGYRVPVWNAYDSYVRRTLEIKHALFSGRKLSLSMKIHRMSAQGGAFNIIGRSNADSYIP